MSNSHGGEIPLPGTFGQSKTVFYIDGEPAGVLVENVNGRRRKRVLKLATAEAALAWCRSHASALVFLPADAARN